MKASDIPVGLVIAAILAALGVALVVCLILMTRLSIERRVRFAKFLGHAFLVLIAASMLFAAIQQYGR